MKFRNWFLFPHVWNFHCNLYLWTKAINFKWNLDNFFNCLCIEMEHNAYKHMIFLICVMYVGLWWSYLFSNQLWFHNHISDDIALNHWFMAPLHFPNVTHLNLFFLGHMSPSMCFFFLCNLQLCFHYHGIFPHCMNLAWWSNSHHFGTFNRSEIFN